MFAFKKHSPYSLRVHYEPRQLKQMVNETRALYEQIDFMINRVKLRWEQIGLTIDQDANERPGHWYTKIFENISRSVLKVDRSVLEFNRHADDFEIKFNNLKEILIVMEQNLLLVHGVGGDSPCQRNSRTQLIRAMPSGAALSDGEENKAVTDDHYSAPMESLQL